MFRGQPSAFGVVLTGTRAAMFRYPVFDISWQAGL